MFLLRLLRRLASIPAVTIRRKVCIDGMIRESLAISGTIRQNISIGGTIQKRIYINAQLRTDC